MSLNFRQISFLGLALTAPAFAGTFSLSQPLTDDAGTQISPANNYTHAISGGGAGAVNGVNFAALTTAVSPAGFTWVSTGGKAEIAPVNNGDWVAAAGGVTGAGLQNLLGGFTYAPQGAAGGSSQTFTLSGLSAGTLYDTRLYIRIWDTEGGGRPVDFTMTSGAEIGTFSIQEDRPGTVLGTGNQQQAYYLNYRFTALSPDLVINAAVPAGGPADSGSFHFYGLTNQAVPEPGSALFTLLAAGTLLLRRRR